MLWFKCAAQQMIKQGLGGVLIGDVQLQVHFLSSYLSWDVVHLFFLFTAAASINSKKGTLARSVSKLKKAENKVL